VFTVGRKGGDLFLRRRFRPTTVDRAMAFYQRFGAGAIAVPAILPPPTPFKLLTLLAGAAGMHPLTFALSVTAGRMVRYLIEGVLAVEYGDRAWAFLADHQLALVMAVAAICVAAYVVWRQAHAVTSDADLVNSQLPTSNAQSRKPRA